MPFCNRYVTILTAIDSKMKGKRTEATFTYRWNVRCAFFSPKGIPVYLKSPNEGNYYFMVSSGCTEITIFLIRLALAGMPILHETV